MPSRIMVSFFLLPALLMPTGKAGENVSRGPFKKVVVVNGRIVSGRAERILAPRTSSWRIEIKWMAEEGSMVTAGEPVVRFDNSGLLEELQGLETELETKQNERESKLAEAVNTRYEKDVALQEATIQYEKAKLKADIPADLIEAREHQENQLALLKAEKALEGARLDRKTTFDNLDTELAVIDLEIKGKLIHYERLRQTIDSLEIEAQSEGVVIYENHPWEGHKLQVGDTAQTGWGVMHIPDLSSLLVEAYVSETDLNFLEVGQPAAMTLDAYPDRTYGGKVLEINKKGTVQNQWGEAPYFRIRIALDELDGARMRPGMSLRTEIVLIEREDVLLAPLQMAYLTEKGWWVKPEGNKPVPVEPIGFNAFHLALPREGPLAEGAILEAITGKDDL